MRDSYLDVCKGGLIFLVVFGHFIERLIGWNHEINRIVLSTIYLIHMPAFIFISGMLFKDKNIKDKIIYFISIFIPFQIAYMILHFVLNGELPIYWLKLRPYWVLWYLVAMMGWVLLSHILLKTKFPISIAIALSLIIGFSPIDNSIMSIGRIFTFLPFFLIGCIYGNSLIQIIKSDASKISGFFILIGLFVMFAYINLDESWLFGLKNYTMLGVDWIKGVTMRSCLLIASFIGLLSILSVFRFRIFIFLEKLGRNSLSVFILHAAVVMVAVKFIAFQENYLLNLLVCLIFSVITCYIFMQDFFEKGIKKNAEALFKLISR